MDSIDKDTLIIETLKKIQAGIVELRNSMTDLRKDMRGMIDEMVSLRTIMGEFIKTDARREGDYLHLAARVDRLEQRASEQDNPV